MEKIPIEGGQQPDRHQQQWKRQQQGLEDIVGDATSRRTMARQPGGCKSDAPMAIMATTPPT